MTNTLASIVAVTAIPVAVLAAVIPARAEPAAPADGAPASAVPAPPGGSAERWAQRSLVDARRYAGRTLSFADREIERGALQGLRAAESAWDMVARAVRSGGERAWTATTRVVRQGLEKL